MHQGKQKGTYDIEPDKNLNAPFYALHGCKDKACPLGDTKAFFKDNTNAKVIEIPNLTHSFLETNKWYSQFVNAYHQINSLNYGQPKISTQNIIPLPNMPLTYVQAAKSDTFPFVFLITGDGGWTSFEESFCAALAAKGMPVIALDAQKYFWAAKTPDGTTVDISKAILHYQSQLHRKRFILVGYSFGACVMPFIAYRLPVPLKQQLAGVFSLSPDETADFEIHIADMLSIGTTEQYKVLDETKKIQYMHPVFIFGQQEDEQERLKFANTGSKVLTLPGTHHYNNNTSALASLIFQEMRK
jgi:type IV secretory pathway VirJ component